MSGAALSGFHAQAVRLSALANSVVNSDNENHQQLDTEFHAGQGGVEAHVRATENHTDLASDMQELSEAEIAYKANAAAFDAGADLWAVLSLIQRD